MPGYGGPASLAARQSLPPKIPMTSTVAVPRSEHATVARACFEYPKRSHPHSRVKRKPGIVKKSEQVSKSGIVKKSKQVSNNETPDDEMLVIPDLSELPADRHAAKERPVLLAIELARAKVAGKGELPSMPAHGHAHSQLGHQMTLMHAMT